MLAWETEQNLEEKIYVSIDNRDERQWRDRYVLQFPTDIDQIEIAEVNEDIEDRQNQVFKNKSEEISKITDKKKLKNNRNRILDNVRGEFHRASIQTNCLVGART